jgi:hypothetical protein
MAMKKGTRKVIFFSTMAIVIGGAMYYYLVFKKRVKGKRADFITNGFVYSVGTKAQAYPKKTGDFGGMLLETYSQDKDYWLAKNSNGQEILLKKSDVSII